MNKTILYALLFLLSLNAVFGASYTEFSDTDYLTACSTVELVTAVTGQRQINVKLVANVQENSYSAKTPLDCSSYRSYFKQSYTRKAWFLDSDLSDGKLTFLQENYGGWDGDQLFQPEWGNEYLLNLLFEQNYKGWFEIKESDDLNDNLAGDIPDGWDVPLKDIFFYYAIGSDSFNSKTPKTNGEVTLTNPITYLSNIDDKRLDTQFDTDEQRAYYVFSDQLNYYYTPIYIDDVKVVLKEYDGSTSLSTRKFSLEQLQNSRSTIRNSIYFPASWMDYRFYNSDSFLETPSSYSPTTEIFVDTPIANLFPETDYYTVETEITLRKNPLYRHASPVDATAEFNEIFDTSKNTGCKGYRDVCYINLYYYKYISSDNQTPLIYDNPPGTDINDPDNIDNANSTSNETTIGDDEASINGSYKGNFDFNLGVTDPITESGSLTDMRNYAEGINNVRLKSNFFTALQTIMRFILEVFVTLYTIIAIGITIYAFFILLPSGYNKFIKKFKELTRMTEKGK